jgi:NitT/TauT family transport system substrate-binding protein
MQLRMWRRALTSALLLALVGGLAACGGDDDKSGSAGAADGRGNVTLRLGYFANVTHAPALIGLENGSLASKLGSDVKLDLNVFNSGSEAVTAFLGDALDASFIGPSPAITGYQQTNGEMRVVSGVASGGAYLVVKSGLDNAADLKGKKIAVPSKGNTQDVALRVWLRDHGVEMTKDGGDVTIVPQENAITLTSFIDGTIDGAWVPEPWATRLVKEGNGKILVDENTLWPDGKYATTLLIVTKKLLDEHPDIVRSLVEATADAVDLIKTDPAEAKRLTSTGIEKATGKPIETSLVDASFDHITFTLDPIASSVQKSAEEGKEIGFLESSDLASIFDLGIANDVLSARRQPAVASS